MKNNNELEKFNEIFKNIDENKRNVVNQLIVNAVFMSEELKKLQEVIKENGCVETYQNGANQFGKKKSSEIEVYNSMIKNYTTVIKQLLDLLPSSSNENDELLDYLKR